MITYFINWWKHFKGTFTYLFVVDWQTMFVLWDESLNLHFVLITQWLITLKTLPP